jgi:hypothetical protein
MRDSGKFIGRSHGDCHTFAMFISLEWSHDGIMVLTPE